MSDDTFHRSRKSMQIFFGLFATAWIVRSFFHFRQEDGAPNYIFSFVVTPALLALAYGAALAFIKFRHYRAKKPKA